MSGGQVATAPEAGGRTARPGLGHLAMLGFSALVAGSFSLGSMAAPHIAPAALNGPRFFIAALLVGVAVMLRGGGAVPGPRSTMALSGSGGHIRRLFCADV